MLESPVLSAMVRSAAPVALASNPTEPNGRIRPFRGTIMSRRGAWKDRDYRNRSRAGKARFDRNQMAKFTVKELPPIGSDGIDIALPFGSFMMIPFGERASFGLALLTLIALNVVEPKLGM